MDVVSFVRYQAGDFPRSTPHEKRKSLGLIGDLTARNVAAISRETRTKMLAEREHASLLSRRMVCNSRRYVLERDGFQQVVSLAGKDGSREPNQVALFGHSSKAVHDHLTQNLRCARNVFDFAAFRMRAQAFGQMCVLTASFSNSSHLVYSDQPSVAVIT